MKKEKLITRTIISSIVDYKFFDMDENVAKDEVITLAGKLTAKEIEIEINFLFGNTHRKFIMINDIDYIEKLYGVTESAFLKIAKELPPRKVNETQEEE